MIENYLIHILILIGIYIILAVSLNIALGYTGLLNLGHIAFFGIGAYTSAILTREGIPFILALIISCIIAGCFGFLLVWITKRLKGDYLALATLGFSFLIYSLMLNLSSITNGPLGISGISRPNIFGYFLKSNFEFLLFVIFIAIISCMIMYAIIKSPFGRLLHATRDDELGLRVLGKNTIKIKYKAMIISSLFAGLAGSLFAHYNGYIDPTSFMLNSIIFIFTIVIVGGIASFKGSIIATFILFIIPELLRFFAIPSHVLGPTRQIIYALILIGILLFKPKGLFGRIDLE
ncbi:branched-chain amino acid ABC transporter permease [Candidatus Woesearchaeota archaeon]|nr:branched-chain amino acid ABC transporter permease [Candidatus Woesearchaeota archaeon]